MEPELVDLLSRALVNGRTNPDFLSPGLLISITLPYFVFFLELIKPLHSKDSFWKGTGGPDPRVSVGWMCSAQWKVPSVTRSGHTPGLQFWHQVRAGQGGYERQCISVSVSDVFWALPISTPSKQWALMNFYCWFKPLRFSAVMKEFRLLAVSG